MARELELGDLVHQRVCLTQKGLTAIRDAQRKHQVTYLTEHGSRVAAIVPCVAADVAQAVIRDRGRVPEDDDLEAEIAELARLQGPYERQLARVNASVARLKASLKG